MKSYEAVFISRPELDEEGQQAVVDKFTGLIQNQGGTVAGVDKMGKRRLAYEINGFRDGHYTLVNFKGEAGVPRELDRVLKISDEVIRHLIIKKDE